MPHGKIKRIDDLISGLNDSIVEVTLIRLSRMKIFQEYKKLKLMKLKNNEDFANATCEVCHRHSASKI